MLATRSLYFASADKLGDRYEGFFSRRNLNREGITFANFSAQDQPRAHQAVAALREQLKRERHLFCISCWHMSEHESDAMWTLYSPNGAGVAIQTSFGRLKNSVRDCPDDVMIGSVKYVDYDRDIIPEGNSYWPFLHKRNAFAHENEVRAIIGLQGKGEEAEKRVEGGGVAVQVDLTALIERVVVNPLAPPWFASVVLDVSHVYGLAAPVITSDMNRPEPY